MVVRRSPASVFQVRSVLMSAVLATSQVVMYQVGSALMSALLASTQAILQVLAVLM